MSEAIMESRATPEQQAEAAALGWRPPDQFKGAPSNFIDADQFLEHSKTFVPFLKRQKQELEAQLAQERAARQQLEATLKETKDSIDAIEERYTVETQKRVEQARKDLRAQIKAAADDNDLKTVVDLTTELEDLNEAERAARDAEIAEAKKPAEKKPPEISPQEKALIVESQAWIDEHTWMKSDPRKRSLFFGFLEARKAGGDTNTGKTLFDAALEDMEDALESKGPGKVASARQSGSGGGGGGGKGYADLPPDARQACDSDAHRFVGKGKKYATKAEWQASYAAIYFKE